MGRYWKQFPPYHVLLAAHVGYKAPDPEKQEELSIEDLLTMFPVQGDIPTDDETPAPEPPPE